MKDQMMLTGVTYGKRFTKEEKASFLSELCKHAEQFGWKTKLATKSSKLLSIHHLYVGDIEHADLVIAAAYDTPAVSFLPGYVYYPFNTQANLKQEGRNQLIEFLITIGLLALVVLLVLNFANMQLWQKILSGVAIGILAIALFRILKGIGNPVNFNRNSASLAIMMKLMEEVNPEDQVAFAFLDSTVNSFEGLKFLKEEIGESKRILLLDCLSKGDTLTYAYRKGKKPIEFESDENLKIHERKYSEEKADHNILAFFENCGQLVSGSIEEDQFKVFDTRTKKDMHVDMNRLEQIHGMMLKSIKEVKK